MRDGFNSVRQLAVPSSLLLAGRVAGAAASFLFAVMLAHSLPVAEVGYALAAISAAFLASVLATVNIEAGGIRFLVAAREAGEQRVVAGFIFFGRMLLLCIAPLIMAAYALLAPGGGGKAALWAALSIPAIAWLRLSGSHATALGRPVAGSLPRTGLQPLLLLLIYPAAMLAGATPSPGLALACFFVSFLVTALVQYLLLRHDLSTRGTQGRDVTGWRDWIANGLYMSPIVLLQDYLQHGVVVVAALALGKPEVAVLAIALRFLSLVRFGILAINMASSPSIARAMARADEGERDRLLRAAALLKTPAAVLACLVIALCAEPILALLGPDYAGGGQALAWFTLIPLASAVFGPNQMLLNVSGARRWVFAVSLSAIAFAFLAIPVSGAAYGVNGAAMAAALLFVAWEAALFAVARTRFGVDASFFAVLAHGVRR